MEPFNIVILVLCILSIPVLVYYWSIGGKNEWRRLGKLVGQMRIIFSKALKGQITESESDRFFKCADEALDMMQRRPFIDDKDDIPHVKDEINKMSNQISLLIAIRVPKASIGEEVDKLAAMRQAGLISDIEFKAFSERFMLSTGEKASSIIKAVAELSEQRERGAMTEGNYHAALWALLDKLDRKT